MSVLGSDWETLKRYNLAELYQKDKAKKTHTTKDGISPLIAKNDEIDH